MVYDRQDAEYNVSLQKIRICTSRGDLSYSYLIQNDKLTLTDDYGKEISLNRERHGIYEDKCVGEYFSGYDTLGCEEILTINDDGAFSYSKQCEGTETKFTDETIQDKISDIDRLDGNYRVQNTLLVLTFTSGTVKQAILKFRFNGDDLRSIIFNGQVFEKEGEDELYVYEPIRGYDPPPPPRPPCIDCYPPPCNDCYDPPPPPPGCPTSGGTPTTPSAPEPARTHRDTGSTRGGSESGNADTGSRQSSGRRPY